MATQKVFRLPQRTSLHDLKLDLEAIPKPEAHEVLIRIRHVALNYRTGGVSITGLIVAKAAGARTIITSSADAKLKYVQKTYGADFIINYKGTDYVFENGGAGTIAESIKAVVYGGSIAVIGFLATCPQDRMPDVAALALAKGALIRGIMIRSKEHLENVTRFFVSKNLTFPVEKEFGFTRDEVIEAFGYVATG